MRLLCEVFHEVIWWSIINRIRIWRIKLHWQFRFFDRPSMPRSIQSQFESHLKVFYQRECSTCAKRIFSSRQEYVPTIFEYLSLQIFFYFVKNWKTNVRVWVWCHHDFHPSRISRHRIEKRDGIEIQFDHEHGCSLIYIFPKDIF